MSIEIRQITTDYVSDYIYDLLCSFRQMPAIPAVRKAALQSMGEPSPSSHLASRQSSY
jgi:hypothetical protein